LATGVILGFLAVIPLLLSADPVSGAGSVKLDLSLCAPGKNRFTTTVDNSFFPLPAGQRWTLAGREHGESLGLRISVLDATESFFRGHKQVTTRVVEEYEWGDTNGNGRIDGREDPIEISRNYFAQTQAGTVCYFGEVVDIYEGGVVVSHSGSWRADARGHAPGIFMPVKPRVGMKFQQEVAPGIALDEATIVASSRKTKVPAGTFKNTITVRDRNPLDGSTGLKVYAEDIGLIVDGSVKFIRY
jgi:hypothetical protein